MLVFAKIKSVQQHLSSLKKGTTIGFVPTMGALHQGHISLVDIAKKEHDLVAVSIFVNPTQFDKKEDLVNYPKTIDADLKLLKESGCDLVFVPSPSEIYSENIQSDSFDFGGLEHEMEGKFRDGHFDGVGTVVKRLLEIVLPDAAYFGEKDFQQLQIIKNLAETHQLKAQIIGCPIYREEDGLAMSSRNTRLTKEQRKAAPFIYKTLKQAKKEFGTKSVLEVKDWVSNEFKKEPVLNLEYFEISDERTLKPIEQKKPEQICRGFIAVFAGSIRLIDNISL